MKRKVLTGCLISFFIVMIVATIISENIYFDSLPVVRAGAVLPGKLSRQFDLTGHIIYDKREYNYLSPFDCSEIAFLAQDGAVVKEGDPIYRVPEKEALRLKKQLQLELLQLEAENDKLYSDSGDTEWAEESRLSYEINALDIEAYKERLAEVEELIQAEGVICANQSGQIFYTAESGNSAAEGQSIAVVSKDTGKRVLQWEMSAADGALFGTGNSVDISVEVLESVNGQMQAVQSVQKLPISRADFSSESQTYRFEAAFPEGLSLSMQDGVVVSFTCRYESPDTYSFVIPTEAVSFESDSSGTIYLLQSRRRFYGEEYYVVANSAQIQRCVGDDTAIVNAFPNAEYVLSSVEGLSDGTVVRIK